MEKPKLSGKARTFCLFLAGILISGRAAVIKAQNFADSTLNKPFNIITLVEDVKPEFADIDDDGDYDLFYGSHEYIYFQENTGSTRAPEYDEIQQNPFGIQQVGDYSRPVFVDIDGDADLDLFIGQVDGDIYYEENTGTASQPEFSRPVINPFGIDDADCDMSKPAFADIDDDGDQDLFFGPGFGGDLMFQENEGSAAVPSFGNRQTNPFGLPHVGRYPCPAFGDLDNDGDQDLLIGTYGVEMYFLENTGTTVAPLFKDPVSNPFGLETDVDGLGAPVMVDIDNDGDLDVFIGTFEGSVLYHENLINHTSVLVIDQPSSEKVIEVFPNPATDMIHIRTGLDLINIELLNIAGRTVWKGKQNGCIEVGQVKVGLYLLRLTDGNGRMYVRKILIR